MEKLLVQLTQEQIAPVLLHLEENVQPKLVADVSSYAPGRQRIWLPYQAPLSNSRPWETGVDDPKMWQWICYICQTHAGLTPDLALVAKGGQINPHRDTSYADYRAIGINLGPVIWGYQRARTGYSNYPQDDSAEKVEIELQGGEVFEFNSKNLHWTRQADPNRWSVNAWTVKPGEQKQKFIAFVKSIDEGPEKGTVMDITDKNPCKGIKKDGGPCSRTVRDEEYCWQHAPHDGEVEIETTYEIGEILERIELGQPITWLEQEQWNNLEMSVPAPSVYITNAPTPEQLERYRTSFGQNIGVKIPDDGRWMFAINTGRQRYPFLERLSTNGVKFTIRAEDTKNLGGPVINADGEVCSLKGFSDQFNLAWSGPDRTFFLDIHGERPSNPSNTFDWSLIGIQVKDVKKLTKRLAEITRLVNAWTHRVRDDRILIRHPDNEQLNKLFKGQHEEIIKGYDGMNFIRRSMISRSYRHDHRIMVRYTGYEYLVKGDCFILDDSVFDKAGFQDYDFIVHPENVKSEFRFDQSGKWRRRKVANDGREMWINKPMLTYWRHHPIHKLRYDSQLSINNPAVMGLQFLNRDLKIAMDKISSDAEKGILPNQQYSFDEDQLHQRWDANLMEMASEKDRRIDSVQRWIDAGLDPRAMQSAVFFAMNGVANQLDKWREEFDLMSDNQSPMAGLHRKFMVNVTNGFRASCSTREMFSDYFGVEFPFEEDKAFYDERYGMVWPARRFIETFRLHGTHDHDDSHAYVPVKLWDDVGVTEDRYGRKVNRVSQLKKHGVIPDHLEIPRSGDHPIMVLYVMRSPNGAGEYSIMDFDFSTWPKEIEFHEELVPTVKVSDLPRPIDEVLPRNMGGLVTSRVYNKSLWYDRQMFDKDLEAQIANPGFGQVCNLLLFHSHLSGGGIPPLMPDELGNIVDATQQGADLATFLQIAEIVEEYKKYITDLPYKPGADYYLWASRGSSLPRSKFSFTSDWVDFDKKVYSAAVTSLKNDIKSKYSFWMREDNHTVKWVKKNMLNMFDSTKMDRLASWMKAINQKLADAYRADYYHDLPVNAYTAPIAARNKRLAIYSIMDDVVAKFTTDSDGNTLSDNIIAERVMMAWVAVLTPYMLDKQAKYGASDAILATTNTDGIALMDLLPKALLFYGYDPSAEV